MWGSKKKKADEEERNNRDSDFSQFELKQKLAATKFERKTKTTTKPSEAFSKLREIVDVYISAMEDFVEGPQFDLVVNPQSIQTMITQLQQNIPGDNPQVNAVIGMIASMDESQLKLQIKMGIQAVKGYLNEIESIATDPEKLNAALDQFPAESRDIIAGLMNGDLEPLKSKIINEPSIDYSVKKIIISLLDGDSEGALSGAKKFLSSNPASVELIRNQLLATPEVAEMMGISSDMITDKKKWTQAMEDGLDVLSGLTNLGGSSGSESMDDLLLESSEEGEVDVDGEFENKLKRGNRRASAMA